MSRASAPVQPGVDRLRRVWRDSPLPAGWGWWSGELRALMPLRWQRALGSGADWFVLRHITPDWVLSRAGDPQPLAQWDASSDAALQQQALRQGLTGVDREDLRLVLGLPAAAGLQRTLQLPLAARDNLAQVMAFEIDRQTPFRPEQVYVDVRAIDQPAVDGRFAAELVAVPRTVVDPLLQALASAGITVDAVDLLVDGRRRGVNLLPPAQRPARPRPGRRLNAVLAAICVLLALLALGQWLHNRRVAVAAMEAQVATMQPQAQQVIALRQQLQDNAGAAGFLTRRKAHSVSRLALLRELTQRLPDSAWLERLSVDASGQIGFQGQAKKATSLVDALNGATLIRDPGFQGSIQADPSTGKDRFYMVAQVRQPAAPAASPAASTSAGSRP